MYLKRFTQQIYDDLFAQQAAHAYAKRWGIEVMFSDFKSRGVGLSQSQWRLPAQTKALDPDHGDCVLLGCFNRTVG